MTRLPYNPSIKKSAGQKFRYRPACEPSLWNETKALVSIALIREDERRKFLLVLVGLVLLVWSIHTTLRISNYWTITGHIPNLGSNCRFVQSTFLWKRLAGNTRRLPDVCDETCFTDEHSSKNETFSGARDTVHLFSIIWWEVVLLNKSHFIIFKIAAVLVFNGLHIFELFH
jgi:hypothetical protein